MDSASFSALLAAHPLTKVSKPAAPAPSPRNSIGFEKLDLLSSLSFFATNSGSSPRSDGGETVAQDPFNRKRSYQDLLEGDIHSFNAKQQLQRQQQESRAQNETLSPKRAKTISDTFFFPTQLEEARHQQRLEEQMQKDQRQQQQDQLALFASSSFLNLLLAQNAINKSFTSRSDNEGRRSLFDARRLSQMSQVSHISGMSNLTQMQPTSDDATSDTETSSALSDLNTEGKNLKRKSSFRGVIWDKNSRAWRAKLSVKGKLMHVGLFEDEKEAAIAWDKKAIEVRGHKTRLNFPELIPDLYMIELKSRRIRKRI